MPSTLQTLINAIPTAQDGNVIASTYHNTLRAAVVELATQLESLAGGGINEVATFTPMLFPVYDSGVKMAEWLPAVGLITRPQPGADADGWMSFRLPDGARITQLAVIGRKTGSHPVSLRVWMYRNSVAAPSPIQMISINLKTITGEPFQVNGDVSIAGATPSVIEDYRKIDNSLYQYFIEAKLVGAYSDTEVDFFAFQVSYSTVSLA